MGRILEAGALALLAALLVGSCLAVRFAPGERLFRSKCGACHLRPERRRFDRSGWEGVLDSHRRRFPLTAAERKQLLRWLAGPETPPRPAERDR